MNRKYRIITEISSSGKEIYNVESRLWWLPFWFQLGWFWDEDSAINKMNLEKRKDAYKRKVVRLG